MNFREQLHKARYGPICNIGGSSKSAANTTSNTTTSSSQTNTDNSMMLGDGGVGVHGSSNLVDQSAVNNTSFTDQSDRSTSFTSTVTDFGSVSAALSGMGSMGKAVTDMSGAAVMKALDSAAQTGQFNLDVVSKAFDFTKSTSANALTSASDVMGFAASSIDKSNAAFAEAQTSTDNKTVIYVGLAVVAAIGLAVAMKE